MVRDAARTRPCMYTVRGEATKDTEKRAIADRRTYGHMRQRNTYIVSSVSCVDMCVGGEEKCETYVVSVR